VCLTQNRVIVSWFVRRSAHVANNAVAAQPSYGFFKFDMSTPASESCPWHGLYGVRFTKLFSSSLQLKATDMFWKIHSPGNGWACNTQKAPQLSQIVSTLDAAHIQSRTSCCQSTLSQLCSKVSARDFEQGCCSHRSRALHTSYWGLAALFAWHIFTDFPNTSVCFMILFVPFQH